MKRIWALILTVSFIFTVLPASAESGYDAFVYLFQTIFEGETPYTSDDYPELISQTEYLEDFGTDQVCIVTIILFGEANTVSVLGRNDQNDLAACCWILDGEEYSVVRLFYNLCKNWEELSPAVEPGVQLVFQFLYAGTDYPPIIITNQEEAEQSTALWEQVAGDQWHHE